MTLFTRTLTLVSALVSGEIYESKTHSSGPQANAKVQQEVDTQSAEERQKIMLDARLEVGRYLRQN